MGDEEEEEEEMGEEDSDEDIFEDASEKLTIAKVPAPRAVVLYMMDLRRGANIRWRPPLYSRGTLSPCTSRLVMADSSSFFYFR